MNEYYDWQHLVKPQQWNLVAQDTVANTKPLSVTPVQPLKTGTTYVKIPSGTFNAISASLIPCVVGQYNYSVGDAITITNSSDLVLDTSSGYFSNIVLAIRYRVGTVVYRYVLDKTFPAGFNKSLIPYPVYSNQIIKGNFVIEIWQVAVGTLSINKDVYLDSGRIYFPSSLEDTGNILTASQTVTLANLQTALPAVLDNYDASGPWLTN